MSHINTSDLRFRADGWRKSSRSDSNNACVEFQAAGDLVGVCDSKQNQTGPVLAFPAGAWRDFTDAVKGGNFHAA